MHRYVHKTVLIFGCLSFTSTYFASERSDRMIIFNPANLNHVVTQYHDRLSQEVMSDDDRMDQFKRLIGMKRACDGYNGNGPDLDALECWWASLRESENDRCSRIGLENQNNFELFSGLQVMRRTIVPVAKVLNDFSHDPTAQELVMQAYQVFGAASEEFNNSGNQDAYQIIVVISDVLGRVYVGIHTDEDMHRLGMSVYTANCLLSIGWKK